MSGSRREDPCTAPAAQPATSTTPNHWQHRAPTTVDAVQYQAWCDEKLAAMTAEPAGVQQAAAAGIDGPATALPHRDAIQASFGHHDVSGVQAHVGGQAADASAQMGAQAYAAGNHVAFAAQPNLHLAAHEAAHVVQQRGGVQLKGGVGEAGDPYEQHANAVADAVVRGESAAPLLDQMTGHGGSAPAVQRFGAKEHQQLGNDGSRGVTVTLAPGYVLDYGDVVALAGDHFESIDQMRAFAQKPHGAASRAEIEYARHWMLGADTSFDDEAKAAQEKRYWTLAAKNQSHFRAPTEADRHRSLGTLSGMQDETDFAVAELNHSLPTNNVAGYRQNHVRALLAAARVTRVQEQLREQGDKLPPHERAELQQRASISTALADDAFACHFLTDAFAAGHIRTPRLALKQIWDDRVPMFGYNLIGFMSERIAIELGKVSPYSAIGAQVLYSEARQIVEGKLRAMALPTFGDLLAGALHDLDNHEGVVVEMGGERVRLYGDGSFMTTVEQADPEGGKPRKVRMPNAAAQDTVARATEAVRTSVDEVHSAFTRGASSSPVETVRDLFNEGGGMFAAEALVPDPAKIDRRASPEIKWGVADLKSLFDQKLFQKAIAQVFAEKSTEIVGMAAELGGAKGAALERAMVPPMLSTPVQLLQQVINWTPTADPGVTTDSRGNASAYVTEATRTHGGMASLSREQRERLLNALITPTPGTIPEGESMEGPPDFTPRRAQEQILALFEGLPREEIRGLIDEVGKDKIRARLDFDLMVRFGMLT